MESGLQIIDGNKPGDEAFLVRFISSDKIETVQDVTADKGLLKKGLESLYVEAGQTAILDALYVSAEALTKLKSPSLHRRALILVTDGEDRNSFYKREQLFNLLGSTDIQIFVIGFTKELKGRTRDQATQLLTRLATYTGGRVFFPQSNSELPGIANEIINDMRTQYMIGYIPTDQKTAASFHKVEVSLADDPSNEKRIAVTRLGYSVPKRD